MVRSSARAFVPMTRITAALAILMALLVAAGPDPRASARPVVPRSAVAGPAAARSVIKPVSLASLHWIFYREDIDRIDLTDPGLVRTLASGPGTYELEHRPGGQFLPAGITPVQLFSSTATFRAAIRAGTMIPGITAVAYDLEFFHLTPVTERQEPLAYLREFAVAAHASGYQPILIPGRDLVRQPGAACVLRPGLTISQAYVNCGIPATAANASIYVIQAAPVETNLPALRDLVRQSAAQARRANPNIVVIATLATAPNNVLVTSSALTTAARNILPYVDGFELNSKPWADRRVVSFLENLARG